VGHSAIVNDLCFSDDGARLVSSSNDGTARVWDTGAGCAVCVHTFSTPMVRSVSLSNTGLLAVALRRDHEVRALASDTGQVAKVVHVDYPFRVRFAPAQPGAASNGDGTRLFFSQEGWPHQLCSILV